MHKIKRRQLALLTGCVLLLAACGGTGEGEAETGDAPIGVTTTTSSGGSDGLPPDSDSSPDASDGSGTGAPPPSTTTTTAAAPSGPSATIQAIRERGTLRVGVTSDQLPFRSFDGQGFEMALAAAVAELLEPGTPVEVVQTTNSGRFDHLAVGQYDVLVGSVHTISRSTQAAFSRPYLLNGLVAVVAADSGIIMASDLAGTTVALPDGRIQGLQMEEALAAAGISFTPATISNSAQGEAGVLDGSYSAFAASWSEAALLRDRNAQLAIVPVAVNANPFGLATSLNDPAFTSEVDGALGTVIADGTWLSLFNEWFGGPPAWTVDEMSSVEPS